MTHTDPKTHIYKILNPVTGLTRVVHRNMLLCVNFLPVAADAESGSFSSDSSCSVECDDTDFSFNQRTGGVDKVALTNEWVSQIPVEEPGVESPDNVLHSETPDMAGLTADNTSVINGAEVVSVVSSQESCTSDTGDNGVAYTCLGSSVPHIHVETLHSPVSTEAHDTPTRRSRVGRILRPVDRLIYNMSAQKTLASPAIRLRKWASSVLSVGTCG